MLKLVQRLAHAKADIKADADKAKADIENKLAHERADIKADAEKAKADAENKSAHERADAEKAKAHKK